MTSGKRLARLQEGLARLGEDYSRHPCERYLGYLDLLHEWNQAYNLTGITDPESMITRHLLDCLAAKPFIRGTRCLDVGSGPGLPGLVLAMASPEQHWTLLDSGTKKVRFMNHVRLVMQVRNIEVVKGRVEKYEPAQPFDTVITRAFSALPEYYRAVYRLVSGHGRIISMKGELHDRELAELGDVGITYATVSLVVPGLDRQRNLVIFERD